MENSGAVRTAAGWWLREQCLSPLLVYSPQQHELPRLHILPSSQSIQIHSTRKTCSIKFNEACLLFFVDKRCHDLPKAAGDSGAGTWIVNVAPHPQRIINGLLDRALLKGVRPLDMHLQCYCGAAAGASSCC